MRLRTFNAADIHEAMDQIREVMGEDAVIISTTRDPSGKGVSITAAADEEDDFDLPEDEINDDDAQQERSTVPIGSEEAKVFIQLKSIFAYHSVPPKLADDLLDTAKMLNFDPDATYEGVRKTLAKLLDASFQFLPLPLNRAGFRIMLVGPPGVGKTMTIAKMAAQMVMDKKNVTVITTDTKRAGGVEQLQAFTDILNIELKIAEDRTGLRAILNEVSEEGRILIDSAGTNPYNAHELKELGEFLGVGSVEPVLTIPCGGDASEAADIAHAFNFTGAKRMLATRVDISRRFGSILSAAHAGGYAFCNASSSAKVVGEYNAVDEDYLSNLLMQYRLND